MRRLRVLALVCAGLLAGCATYGGDDVGSGIFGVAMAGPTCPVEREPPDPACADRAYEGTLVATRVDGGVAGSFSTDAGGRFNVSLSAGEYIVRTPDPSGFPRCESVGPVVVREGAWTEVVVACDTGIR